jgi:hypothetical protein
VIRDPAGDLYGTTSGGGTANAGVDGGRWGQPLFRDPSAAEHVMAGTDADEDLRLLISNTDDHLRNYGFLYAGPAGWRLAPAYDLNPVPTDIKPRILTTAIDLTDGTASLKLALEVAAHFELGRDEARKIAAEVGRATATWRREAKKLGLTAAEIDRMASSFEHQDLKEALGRPAVSMTTSGPKAKWDRRPVRYSAFGDAAGRRNAAHHGRRRASSSTMSR